VRIRQAAACQPGDEAAKRGNSLPGPAGSGGRRPGGLAVRDDQAPQLRVRPDTAIGPGWLVDGAVGSWLSGVQPGPERAPDPLRRDPVQEPRSAVPVPDVQQKQATGPERRGEAVQDQLDVRYAVQQQRAVHDVERARPHRDRTQVPEDGLVSRRVALGGSPRRAVFVDRQHRDLKAAAAQLVKAEFVE
jgi:hypothetical protein